MRSIRTIFTIFTLLLSVPPSYLAGSGSTRIQSGAAEPRSIAFIHGNLLDVRTGTVRPNSVLIVRDGRIERIDDTAPSGMEVIDLRGRTVLPGLIDAHTHLSSLSEARRALESGVTTVRSASVGSYRDVVLKKLVQAGVIAGPDVLAAGVFVTPDLGDTILADSRLIDLWRGVRSEADLRKLVRVNIDNGVDVIKTRATERAGLPDTDPRKQVYSEQQLRAVVDEAASKGIPVEVHAHGDEGARAAVLAGARSIEHGTYLSQETLDLMKEKGTFLVPTYATVVDLTEAGGDYDDPVLTNRGRHMLPRLRETIRMAHASGVKIVTGADTSYGPQSLTRISHEVAYLVEAGLSPLQAIQSATIVAAELLGIKETTGVLEIGREADFIAVEGNPLDNIIVLQDVLLVVSNGRVGLNRLDFSAQ